MPGATISLSTKSVRATVLKHVKITLADFWSSLLFCTVPTSPKVTFLHRNSILAAFQKMPPIYTRAVESFYNTQESFLM